MNTGFFFATNQECLTYEKLKKNVLNGMHWWETELN